MNTRNRTLRHACSVVALCAMPVLLSACSDDSRLDRRLITAATWKQNQPLPQPEVRRIEVQHVVAFRPQALDMTDVEREALDRFLQESNLRPGTHVSVAAPTKTVTQAARARNRLAAVRTELQRFGVSSSVVSAQPTTNQSTGDEVVVFAQTVAVLPPDCPGYNTPIVLDEEWRPIDKLGCANAVNLGLMVANPADLAQGRPIGPADGEAQALQIQRYKAGQVLPSSASQTNVPFRINTN